MLKFSDLSNVEKWNFSGKGSLDPAAAVYNETVMSVKRICGKVSQEKDLDIDELSHLTERLINSVSTIEDKIIFFTSNIYVEDYFLYHTVNMAILSIKMGIHLNYPHQSIVNLGIFAILHGMDGAEGESCGAQDLKTQKFIQKFIQEKQIKDNFANEALGVIAVLDVYESLTHNRSYRPRFMPYEILQAIISAAEQVFNPQIVKEIINIFSIYPLGTMVRLSTEEIAGVIRINRNFPLRPEIVVLMDRHGNELKEKRTIDLAVKRDIYIKEPLIQNPTPGPENP